MPNKWSRLSYYITSNLFFGRQSTVIQVSNVILLQLLQAGSQDGLRRWNHPNQGRARQDQEEAGAGEASSS